MPDSSGIATETAGAAADRLQRGLQRIRKSLSFLGEEELWKDFSPNLSSIGNLMLHLIGNVSQHVLSGLGGRVYERRRDQEFTAKPGIGKTQLWERLSDTVGNAVLVIRGLSEEDLSRTYTIQGMRYSGLADVVAVLEHFSYHVGQIAFAVKLLKNVQLGLSEDAALNR